MPDGCPELREGGDVVRVGFHRSSGKARVLLLAVTQGCVAADSILGDSRAALGVVRIGRDQ